MRQIVIGMLLLAFGRTARSESNTEELLRSIAFRCRDLYLHGYAVDVVYHRTDHRRFDAGFPKNDRASIPMPQMNLPGDGKIDRILMARSGRSLRFEMVNSLGENWQWTTNGETTWCYRRDLKAYTEMRADPWLEPLGPGDDLAGRKWKYFTKFLAIADMKDRARVLKEEIPPDQNCDGVSVLIELAVVEGEATSKEQLRVLSSEHLPCQSTAHFTRVARGMPYDFEENTTWRFRDRIDPSLLVFAPDKHAKRVVRFPRH